MFAVYIFFELFGFLCEFHCFTFSITFHDVLSSSDLLSSFSQQLLFRFKAAGNAVQRLAGFGRFLAKESQARPPKTG